MSKICIRCEKPFVPKITGQVTCTACLNDPFASVRKNSGEDGMSARNYKIKKCKKCKMPYQPTGPRQELCEKCRDGDYDPETDPSLSLGIQLDEKRSPQFEKEKNQRISVHTFVRAGKVCLEDLGIDGISLVSQGLRVSVEKVKNYVG